MKQNDGLVFVHLATFITQLVIFAVQVSINYLLMLEAKSLAKEKPLSDEYVAVKIEVQ